MFTGIIEEVGKVRTLARGSRECTLSVEAHKVLEDARLGDSIAVNGVCLTLTRVDSTSFSADVMNETLARSSLASLAAGCPVNLERAMKLGGRLGGHIVTGHIDGTGTISAMREDGNAMRMSIAADPAMLSGIVEKGSIALDGISLTVADVGANLGSGLRASASAQTSTCGFSVSVIPHTRACTNLASKRVGDAVNIELDIIGKYVAQAVRSGAAPDASGAFGTSGMSDALGASDAAALANALGGGGAGARADIDRADITEALLHECGF